jgi:hypothetical protein
MRLTAAIYLAALLAIPFASQPGIKRQASTFDNIVVAPAVDSTAGSCGPVDTWNCWGACRAAGPFRSGGSVLAVLVGADCEPGAGSANTCACHWQPVGIGVGGIGAPCPAPTR